MTRSFFPVTGHNVIPDGLHRLWLRAPGVDLEHAAFEPASALVAGGLAFAFGPESDEDGEIVGWSWAEWGLDEGQWVPVTFGDGSGEESALVDAAAAWLALHAPSTLSPDDLLDTRTALGLNQGALADLLGVDQSTVSRWESGERGGRGIPAGLKDDLDAIVDAFMADVESGSISGPWVRAARFWNAHRGQRAGRLA